MTSRVQGLAAGVVVAVPFLLGATSGGSEDGRIEFRFRDPAIVESSGLVVADGLFVTVNDSGDSARVFTVDPATGRTVGVTTWAAEPVDVEALAPASRGEVWVGDVGDNQGYRESVTVTRVPVGRGSLTVEPPSYELVLPGRPTDAETLLAHPTTGRLYVVTKTVFGGVVYEAPARLDPDRPNRLTRIGEVLGIATDGAFLPDGEHVVVRDYGRAVFYTFPGLEEVGEVRLPTQEQGEGIAVDTDFTVHVSSEGVDSPVYRVDLPTALAQQVAPSDAPVVSPAPTPPGSRVGTELPESTSARRPAWPWFLTGGAGLGLIMVLVWSLRRR